MVCKVGKKTGLRAVCNDLDCVNINYFDFFKKISSAKKPRSEDRGL